MSACFTVTERVNYSQQRIDDGSNRNKSQAQILNPDKFFVPEGCDVLHRVLFPVLCHLKNHKIHPTFHAIFF
jgi:hypothetical protein